MPNLRESPSGRIVLRSADQAFFGFNGLGAGPTWSDRTAMRSASPVVAPASYVAHALNGANWTINPLTGIVTYRGESARVIYAVRLSLSNPAPVGLYCELQASKNGQGIGAYDLDPFSWQEFLVDSDQIVTQPLISSPFEVVRGDTLQVIGAADKTVVASTVQINITPIL